MTQPAESAGPRELSDSDPTGRPSGLEQEAWNRILDGCATIAPYVTLGDYHSEAYGTIHSSLVGELQGLGRLPLVEARRIIDYQTARIAARPDDFQELQASCQACGKRGGVTYHLLRFHPYVPRDRVTRCTGCGASHEVESTSAAPHQFVVNIPLAKPAA